MPERQPRDLEDQMAALTERVRRLEKRNPTNIAQGTMSNRPVAGTVNHGTFYHAIDTNKLYYSTGSTWLLLN